MLRLIATRTRSSTWLVLCYLCCTAGAGRATDSPNIILIMVDDQSWNGTSVAMDPNEPRSKSDFYQTPSLERLASEGMRFSNAYSAAAVCSPTRAALVTGKSPAQLNYHDIWYPGSVRGFANHPLAPPQVLRLDPNEEGIAQRVKQADSNYATGLVGKWHLAGASPQDMGFDYYDERLFSSTNDPIGTFAKNATAMSFMETQVAASKPFFLELSHIAVHDPIRPSPDALAKYQNLPPGTLHKDPAYAGFTEDLDTSIGHLLDRVESLGIKENTYIIYASDNGAERRRSRSDPLAGGKKSIFDGGIRTPLIVSGPGIAANSHSDVPVSTVDLFSTVSDLAGNATPFAEGVEGASLRPLLHNGGQLPEGVEYLDRVYSDKGAIFFMSPSNIATDRTYRLRPMAAVRQGDYKLLRVFGENGNPDQNMLFDLGASHFESDYEGSTLNVAGDHPEVAEELIGRLDHWIESADIPLPYNVAAPTAIEWRANRLRGHKSEAEGDQWRSVTDVQQKFRETWYQPNQGNVQTQQQQTDRHQRGLPQEALVFNGNNRLQHQFFHVSEPKDRNVVRLFPTGEADFDRSVSYEFWVRLEDLNNDHILFEAGSPDQGLSVTLGDADNDGSHSDARFRVVGANGESIAVTGDIARFADPTKDFVHLAVVYNDDPTDRFAQIFANGYPVARTQGLSGTEHSLPWDHYQQGFDDASLGNAVASELGAAGGSGDQPFAAAGLRGEISVVRYHNHAISNQAVLANYNDALDPVGVGVETLAGDVALVESRPASVGLGDAESNKVVVFAERRDQLSEDLAVDFLTAADGAGTLPAGNAITSYLFHFDPEGSQASSTELVSGFAVFDKPILGLIFESDSLAMSDTLLGSVGNYGEQADRGLTLDDDNYFAISGGGNSLFFDFSVAGDEMLQFRVLTERTELHPADLNFDAQVDTLDLAIWRDAYGVSDEGDVNEDGFSDGADFLAYQRPFVEEVVLPISADFDDDGDIDEEDLTLWKTAFGISGDGDADQDGVSVGSDFLIWQQQRIANPDFNGDSSVDSDDLAIWRSAFGQNADADANSDTLSDGDDFLTWQTGASASSEVGTLAVPEPQAFALLVAACWAVAWTRSPGRRVEQ